VGVGKRTKGGVAGDEAIIHPTEVLAPAHPINPAANPES